MLEEARAHLATGSRPSAAELDAAGMVVLTAAHARLSATAQEFADEPGQTAGAWLRAPLPVGQLPRQSPVRCALYRIGGTGHPGGRFCDGQSTSGSG